MTFPLADRVRDLPPYLFADLDKKKAALQAKGINLISLSIGDPDQPTPAPIVEAMGTAIRRPAYHQYPSYIGAHAFRQAACDWIERHYRAAFSPEEECIALIGSKEGIAHFPLAFLNPGDIALLPDPGYPVYNTSTQFCGAVPYYLPLRAEHGFLPSFREIPADIAARARILFLNYPNNPTAACATRTFFAEAVAFARAHRLCIVHDAAYMEIFFDNERPPSIFEVEGARDVAIEFHSLSKTFNMTGWRIGFAVGHQSLVSGLAKIKTNVDSGVFTAVQDAGVTALTIAAPTVESIRASYQHRRDRFVDRLRKGGWDVAVPKATFYLWTRVPTSESSTTFVTRIMEQAGVILTPGVGFGAHGEGYVRFTLTADADRLEEAADRIARVL
ncbi:MAG: LL-diaminopimelate aminotransferase [Deltaproteobacteria bacterium]|nr:LL-diaminopimelate aminotransferase [Deltaproteobacteria bacterium]